MTPRGLLNFVRSRTGAFLLFLVLMGIGFVLVNGFHAPDMAVLAKSLKKGEAKTERKAQVVETVTRDMTAFNPPQEAPAPMTPPPAPEKRRPEQPPSLPPIRLLHDWHFGRNRNDDGKSAACRLFRSYFWNEHRSHHRCTTRQR